MNRAIPLILMVVLTAWGGGDSTSGPAGVYKFEITTTGPTTITRGDGWYKIEWDVEPTIPAKPDPPVVKPPDPGLPVTPTPAPPTVALPVLTGPIWVAAVYDRSTAVSLPAGQQALLLSKTITPTLAKLDATWSSWDKSDPGLKGWGPDAGTTYPALLVIWNQGTKSQSWPLPADENTAVAFVGKLRGQ